MPHLPASSPAAPAPDRLARCTELCRRHGFVVYDRADGSGRFAFHPYDCAISLRLFEVRGESRETGSWGWDRMWAPDAETCDVLASVTFSLVHSLTEFPAPPMAEAAEMPEGWTAGARGQPSLPLAPAVA